jgi:hypothetical protein
MVMITTSAEKIININDECVFLDAYTLFFFSFRNLPSDSFMIDEDINTIIQRGEERRVEPNSKYEGLNLDDARNLKSDTTAQQLEGDDFRSRVSTILMFRVQSLCLNMPVSRRSR